jgi:hypothetical protein
MSSFWDLLPASAWPVQRFISPDEQAQTLQAALSLGVPLDWSALLPVSSAPTVAAQPSPPQQQAYSAALGGDDSAASSAGPPRSDPTQGASGQTQRVVANPSSAAANPLGGLLGAFFGPKAEIPPASAAQDGVVPKTLPPDFRMPPAISDWQRPESYFQQQQIANINRILAGGVDPGPIALEAPGRAERDAARGADFLLPGSGNVVSGDWNNITAGDVAKLALSAALAAGSFGIESSVARAAAAATRRGLMEAEAADAAARAATLSRAPASGSAPFVGKINAPPQPLAIPIEPAPARSVLPQPELAALPPPPKRLALPARPDRPPIEPIVGGGEAPPLDAKIPPQPLSKLVQPPELRLPPLQAPPEMPALFPSQRWPALPAPSSYPALAGPKPGTQQAWEGTINAGPVPKGGMVAYRVWGGGSPREGLWLSPTPPVSTPEAISRLSLHPGNTARYVSRVYIPEETQIQWGKAAPVQWDKTVPALPGGGDQIWLVDDIPNGNYGSGMPLRAK